MTGLLPVIEALTNKLLFVITACLSLSSAHTPLERANLRSGYDNFLYDRYSNLVVIIAVNMMYGVGLPLLFPLTLFSIVL